MLLYKSILLTLRKRERIIHTTISYKKLWNILLDRDMKKKDLQEAAGLTGYGMLKLSRDENVTTEVLGKICLALNCTTDEIMEFIPESED